MSQPWGGGRKKLGLLTRSANKKAKIQPSVLSYFTSSSRDKVTSPDTEEMAFVFEGLESQEISHDDTEPVSGLTQLLPSASVSLPNSQDAPPVVNFGVSVPAVITSQGEHFHKNRVFRAEWQLQHPWLQHSMTRNVAWCQYCVWAVLEDKFPGTSGMLTCRGQRWPTEDGVNGNKELVT